MKRKTPKLIVLVLLCGLVANIALGCTANNSEPVDVQTATPIIEDYRDIPDLTEAEIEAVEAFKATGQHFSYATLITTEMYQHADGEYAGFIVGFSELLSNLLGIPFDLKVSEWDELLEGLNDTTFDFTSELTPTVERMQRYSMTQPIAERNLLAFSLSKSPRIEKEDDLKGMTVGFLSGTITAQSILQLYPTLDFTSVDVSSTSDAIQKLQSGVIDAFIDESPSAVLFEGADFSCSRELFSMVYTPIALTTANPELKPIISVVDKFIQSGGISQIHELYIAGNKEYNKYAFFASLTEEEVSYLKNLSETGKKVPIALESQLYPISFYNYQEQEYQGIAPDILTEICALTDIDLDVVTDENTSWSKMLEMLETGEISLVSELLYLEERVDKYLFSEYPYASSRYALISKLDYPNLETYQISYAKIGVVADTAPASVFDRYFPNHKNLSYYPFHEDTYEALESGEIDLVMASEHELLTYINYRNNPNYKINRHMSYPIYESYFGFNIDEVLLKSIFDRAMDYIDTNLIEQSWVGRSFDYEKALAIEREHDANQRLIFTSISAIVLFVAFIVLLFFITRDRRKRKVIQSQTSLINAIYDAFPDPVFTKDLDGKYTSVNQSSVLFVEREKEALLGKTAEEAFFDDDEMMKAFIDSDREVIKDNKVVRVEFSHKFSDGTCRTYEETKAPLVHEGQVTGLLGFMRDITEHKTLLEQIKRQTQYELVKYSLTSNAMNIVHCDVTIVPGETVGPDTVVLWHDEFLHMLGIENKDDFPDVLSSFSNRLHSDDRDRVAEVFYNHLNDRTGKTICDFECRLMLTDDTYKYFRIAIGTMRDEDGMPIRVACAIEDINEKRLIHHELAEANRINSESLRMLQNILDILPVGVRIIRTADGVLLYANEAAVKIFNGDSFEVQAKGYTSSKFLPEYQPDGRKSMDVYNEYMQQQVLSTEIQCLKITGEPFIARFTTCRINYQGELCSLGVVEDITAERNHKQILQEIAREEHEANQAKSKFLAKMSHEIRTPMNAIIGMSELALREDMSSAAGEYIATVKQAGVHLLAIINDVLDFSKIEAGEMKIVSVEYSFSALINDVISIIKMRLFDTRIRFVVNVDSHIPDSLIGDITRIRQILLNIMGNAVKYTESGFVSFVIHGSFADDNTIMLSMEVKDSGKGIKKEDLENLFDEYMQADLEKNHGIEGVGLGLTISLSLAKAMGGYITVDSEYGEGSTFTIMLPQKISKPDKIAMIENIGDNRIIICERRNIYMDSIGKTFDDLGVPYVAVPDVQTLCEKMVEESFSFTMISYLLFKSNSERILKAAGKTRLVLLSEFGEAVPEGNWSILTMPIYTLHVANLLNGVDENYYHVPGEGVITKFSESNARILVVDDINTNLKVAEGLLKPYGMKVDLCNSGIEAIEAVKNNDYDLIFMDHRMPGMDGAEATQHIRALAEEDTRLADLPIVALTANAVSGMREVFLESGFDDFLSKPIDTNKLGSILEKWIKGKYEKNEADDVPITKTAFPDGIHIEGIDTEKGLLHVGGEMEIYYETLEIFYDDGYKLIEKIRECLAAGDLHTYTIHVHALKGATGGIGASGLSEFAKELEAAGNSKNIGYIEKHNENFLNSLIKLLEDIKTNMLPVQKEGDPGDWEAFKEALINLKVALENMDARSIKVIGDTLKESASDKHAEAVKTIIRSILISEYDEAVSYIEEILKHPM